MNIRCIPKHLSKLLVITAGLAICSVSAYGSACNTATNLLGLQGLGSCTIANTDFTMTYSGFSITGLSSSLVDISVEFGNIPDPPVLPSATMRPAPSPRSQGSLTL